MALIGVLNSFSDGNVIAAAPHNANWTDVKTAFNTSAVLTDVVKTITVGHTWSAAQAFPSLTGPTTLTGALTVTGLVTAQAGLTLTGALTVATITGPVTVTGAITGSLTGNVTGNVTGNITGTVLTAAQTNITSLGTLTGLTVGGTIALTLDLFLANTRTIRWRNAANTQDNSIFNFTAADNLRIGAEGGVLFFGNAAVTTGTVAGDMVISNNKTLRSVNNAANNTFGLISGNTLDRVVIAPNGDDIMWGKAAVASSGASAFTMGGVVGGGPSVLAQADWLIVYNSAGNKRFIPAWS